jgi:hypothetical protein
MGSRTRRDGTSASCAIKLTIKQGTRKQAAGQEEWVTFVAGVNEACVSNAMVKVIFNVIETSALT